MDSSILGHLLKRLCSHLCGTSTERASESYQLAISFLNENCMHKSLGDCSIICDNIKRWLVHQGRLQDATRFSFLFSKLQHSSVLKNKAEVLYLFLCLGDQGNLKTKLSFESKSFSGQEQISIERPTSFSSTLLSIPSLHDVNSRKAIGIVASSSRVSSGNADNSHQSDKREVPGRVAKLAAMYCDMTDVSKDVLLREILFAFQGSEGNVMKLDSAKDCFKLDSKVRLSRGERELVLKLVELGWLYSKVRRFCDAHGRSFVANTDKILPGSKSCDNLLASLQANSFGLVNQSLILAVKDELNEYCRFVSVLESQLNESLTADHSTEGSVGLSLRRLLMWTLEPRDRLRILASIVDSIKNLRGGASVSMLYQHLQHGDPEHVKIVRNIMWHACRPLFTMLTKWLLDGNLQDPYQDFFISSDPTVPDEKLWHYKYDIRWSMLPSFISKNLAQKMLVTGKSLNFLRHVCNFKSPINGRDAIKNAVDKTTVDSLINTKESNEISELVNVTFLFASSHVLEEILSRHKLLLHLGAIRKYLLLGQGDFIHSLMGLLWLELNKPANRLHDHNLSFLLENAICSSNAQHDEADILKRLDVRLLESSPGETGWDVFSLDYHVDGPIGTVLTSDCMSQYLMLFNSLWKAKRMETIITKTWKHQSATSKLCRTLPELKAILHRVQLLLTEMNHLLSQMAYYMTFEVLECSWHDLVNHLSQARSLDDVIEAHSKFLKKIVTGALLDEESQDIRYHLRGLYNLMMRLESLQETLYNAVVNEVNERLANEERIKERTKVGLFGTTSEIERGEEDRKAEFNKIFIPSFQTDLNVLSQTYQDMVQNFLLTLSHHENENLQFLSNRLDFNEYYLKTNHRLNERLTYHHKRKSMGASYFPEK